MCSSASHALISMTPCTKKRFERWFLIYTGGSVTRVKYTDETDYVEVWEDAASLEYEVWQEIEAQCWHTLPK